MKPIVIKDHIFTEYKSLKFRDINKIILECTICNMLICKNIKDNYYFSLRLGNEIRKINIVKISTCDERIIRNIIK